MRYPLSLKACPNWLRTGTARWQAEHFMPYFRANAGMPAFASYARTAARACGGRPAAGWSVASTEGTATTPPIKSDNHAILCLTVIAIPPARDDVFFKSRKAKRLSSGPGSGGLIRRRAVLPSEVEPAAIEGSFR